MHMPKATVISNRASVLAPTLPCNRSRHRSSTRRLTATYLVWVAIKLSAGKGGTRVIRCAAERLNRLQQEWKQPHRQATTCLLALNGCMFAAQGFSQGAMTQWGMKSNAAIAAGQWWRLITPTFLHLNLLHLGLNSLALNNVGPMVEQHSGAGRFLAIYAISAVTSFAASCMQPVNSVGSSGAVCGVAGALAVLHYRHRNTLAQTSHTKGSFGWVTWRGFGSLSAGTEVCEHQYWSTCLQESFHRHPSCEMLCQTGCAQA
ncbi:hypothetical protein ABBQ32_005010 [Trebouxia sp. C0010 RCD-2024]